ncbi:MULTISPECIES: hypothetical protein [Streptomyces]|uniref:Uncharacterized protein n=1 Tax=Streptomyces spororaveus TaxID=284039 RepID=A0ABQ3TBS8_9ACTN|nr:MULTISPECIES: hypothetical protein [Streptomyces]MCM9081763.1 hypothetical protein [Streptomyces spororaveus]MCX5303808.1 hypothetical protein [Streptomyces sp. NBC_00160]GHI77821.1 hypothetical protein Sspor_33820 [Streptomyces spororaveus]
MRARELRFGLYADEQGLAWVDRLVDAAVEPRCARIVGRDIADTMPGGELPTAGMYDFLAEQWALENPGRPCGTRRPVELRVRLTCSLRTWRSIRGTVIRTLCPEGSAPHTCHVPWMAR